MSTDDLRRSLARDTPAFTGQPAPTASEIPADELAEAESVCREWLPAGRDGTAIYLVMAEYDRRAGDAELVREEIRLLRESLKLARSDAAGFAKERAAARTRIDAAFSVFEAAGYDLSENDGDLVALVADLAAERDVARDELTELRAMRDRAIGVRDIHQKPTLASQTARHILGEDRGDR